MKKLTFLMLALMSIFINEDAEKDDSIIAQQLVGRWMLTFTSDNTANEIYYSFSADSKFRYNSAAVKEGDTNIKSATIDGTWKVYKGVLQLKYDLDSFTSAGLTEAEKQAMYDGFYQSNLLLADMEAAGNAYGFAVTFGKNGNTDTMRMSSVNGLFTRVSY